MGFFNTLLDFCIGNVASSDADARAPQLMNNAVVAHRAKVSRSRRCQIESLEPRRLMAGDAAVSEVLLGSIYFEEATGDDTQPDVLEVTFVGGAAGTKLDRLTINGDKRKDGLSEGDVFFDTAAGGLGAFHHGGLSIRSANGFTVNGVTVVDGGSQIVFNLTGFDAGEKLVFAIDADEAQFIDAGPPSVIEVNPLVEGAEFQRSIMTGEFSAPGYVDLELEGLYFDAFDSRFAEASAATGLSLGLANDKYSADHDFSDRTAGAVAHKPQIPLARLAGWVYHDRSDDGNFDRSAAVPETGIGGVTLELLNANGEPTGITTTTSTNPETLGFYEFRDLFPGKYGVREVQPSGWYDGKDTAGSHGGGVTNDRIFGAVLDFGDHAVNYNFGELLPGSIRGKVGANLGPDCKFDNPDIPLAGVRIDLLDGQGNFIRFTLTNANGDYEFTNLAPGIYRVREHQPTEYYDGGERVGTAGGVASDVPDVYSIFSGITITSGLHAVQYDFCEKVGVTLSGYVYHDRSNDGSYDRTGLNPETPIANVELRLFDANGTDTGLRATTNASGFYKFNNLRAGTYTVVEVHPAGWLDGIDTPGNLSGTADVSPPGDKLSQITINWGQAGVEYNFGELLPGSIRGTVHADGGPDCDFDHPEILLSGVRIDLLDAQGNVIDFTHTDANGNYEFTGLRPGTYAVREHQPEGYYDGGERVGSVGGVASDVAGGFSLIAAINIGSDVDAIEYDFCEKTPSSISGRVHADEHEDCDFDHPDVLLSGVTIELLDAQGNVIRTTTTNANGEYHFDNLERGNYQVREIQPAAYYDGGERVGSVGGQRDGVNTIYDINLPAGTDAVQYDFCERIGVMLSGNVYHDLSNDGVFDRGVSNPETGISGVIVMLLDAGGADTGLRATTDSNGFYKFNNLRAGTYTVMEVHPAGWLDGIDTPGNLGGSALVSPPGDKLSQIVIGWGQMGVEYNFGELLPGSIRGQVVISTDPECDPDDGEPPISGVIIELLNADGNVIASTTTNANGEYEFTGLRPGVYSVREHQPTGYFDLDAHIGSGDGTRLSTNILSNISIGSDEHLFNYDFCEGPPAQLSGYVYVEGAPIPLEEDLSPENIASIRPGHRTGDDEPIAGVTLLLYDVDTGLPVTGDRALPGTHPAGPITTTTDDDGYYEFTGLPAGNYAVVELPPLEFLDGFDWAGSLGGYAVNPNNLLVPPPLPPAAIEAIERFRAAHGDDAIVMISLAAGANSVENNFSELRLAPPELPPPPLLPPDPPVPQPPDPRIFGFPAIPPTTPYLFPLPAPPVIRPAFIGGGSAQGFTWHLSVINAGWPRAVMPTEATIQFTSSSNDAAIWQNAELNQGRWTLAKIDYDTVQVIREEIFGHVDAKAVVGDFNGDGVSDIAVYIDGHWFIDANGNGHWDDEDLRAKLGSEADLPVAGDWDADGKDDIGIYGPAWPRDPWAVANEPGLPDPENFPMHLADKFKNMPPTDEDMTSGGRAMKRTSQGQPRADRIDHVFHYGTPGDIPVAGDWNGDGTRQIGVFRDGRWNLDTNGDGRFTEADAAFAFGESGDKPVTGDFNGDGIEEIGVYRAGRWILDLNNNRELDAQDKVFELGGADDQPVVGDWNDDGRDDPGVYHADQPVDRMTRRAS